MLMRKGANAFLLLALTLAAATPLCSQTRPRRVAQAAVVSSATAHRAEEERTVTPGRARTVYRGERAERRRLGRWSRVLLGAGIAISLGSIGRSRSCAPSREIINDLPPLLIEAGTPR